MASKIQFGPPLGDSDLLNEHFSSFVECSAPAHPTSTTARTPVAPGRAPMASLPIVDEGAMSKDDLQQRLARKAASARIARARHKDHVTGLEDEVRELQQRAAVLETNRLAAAQAASQQLHDEMRAALPAERWETVSGWLRAAAEAERDARQRSIDEQMMQPEMVLYSLAAKKTAAPPAPLAAVNAARAQLHAAEARARRTSFARGLDCPPGTSSGVDGKAAAASAAGGASSGLRPVQAAPPILSALDAETSPTTVMAEEDLLACALGIVGLAKCTPKLQPTAAVPPPAMPPLPPPAEQPRAPS